MTSAPPLFLTQRERELGAIINAYNEVAERLKAAHERLSGEVVRLREQLAEKNRELARRERLAARLVRPADSLPDMAVIEVDPPLAEKLRNGFQSEGEVLARYHIPFLAAGDVIKFTLPGRHLVAVARMLCASDDLAAQGGKGQAVRILRVLND